MRLLIAIPIFAFATVTLKADTPSAPHPGHPPEIALEVSFPKSGVTEIPFRLQANRIHIDVRLKPDTPPLDFVLDTGAGSAILQRPEKAAGLDLKIVGEALVKGAGEGEPLKAQLAQGVEFHLGDFAVRNALLVILPKDAATPLADAPWDGVLGREIFASAVVAIDWDKRLLRLYRPDLFSPPAAATSLPLRLDRGHCFVEAVVTLPGGQPQRVELVVDTGAHHALSLARPKFAVPPTPFDNALLGKGMSGEIRGAWARIASLRLGDLVLENVVTSFPEEQHTTVSSGQGGNLGADLLRRFTTIVDYPHKQLHLIPGPAFRDPFVFSTSGLRLESVLKNGSFLVAEVLPATPAAEAMIKKGDRLVALDGKSVASLGFDPVQDLLRGEPGRRVRLKLERESESIEVDLVLRRLL